MIQRRTLYDPFTSESDIAETTNNADQMDESYTENETISQLDRFNDSADVQENIKDSEEEMGTEMDFLFELDTKEDLLQLNTNELPAKEHHSTMIMILLSKYTV